MLDQIKPQNQVDITYSGLELLDIDSLSHYVQNPPISFTSHMLKIPQLAQDIASGKIIGVARGKAEHGARALGNRTILAHPGLFNIKDDIIIPNYFEPFVRENIEINCAFRSQLDYIIFKADADQDRPSII